MNKLDTNEALLVQQNTGLVVKLARSFRPRTKEELDDLVQIGTIGLIKAIRKHDPAKGKLTTIAWGYIRWEIMRYLNCQQVALTSKDSIVESQTEVDCEQLWEYLPDTLSTLERQTVMLKIEGFNFEDIGKRLGYTRGWTNKVYKSALRKIENANQN
jgi:RNA polymerase sigma-B factor